MTLLRTYQRSVAAVAALLLAEAVASTCGAADAPQKEGNQQDYVPQAGAFPPPNSGTYLAGELVVVDPINRRGALRLDGDGPGDNSRYFSGPMHYFAMLPYGMIWYNGAPAALRDIPLGTHVHGYFYVPPKGEEETIPTDALLSAKQGKFDIPHNHALSLEDDFSFYQRRGQAWKVESVDLDRGTIDVAPTGKLTEDGIREPYTFDIDHVARIWKQRGLVDLQDVQPGTVVQFNLTWTPGWKDREFAVADIWLDEESRRFATELQRRRHVRYQRRRWVPGWIDQVEHFDFGGGILTITMFGGLDPTLYEELKQEQGDGFGVACADKTLRTWFHRADKKIGKVVDWKQIDDPPPGSSGIQVRLKFQELLHGYRPGRCVRLKCHSWEFVTIPTEERLKSREELERSAILRLP